MADLLMIALAAVGALGAALLSRPRWRHRIGAGLAGLAGASLATTIVVGLGDRLDAASPAGVATTVEIGAVLVLTVLAARWAPVGQALAAAVLAAAAVGGAVVLRFDPGDDEAARVAGVAVWALVALAGAARGFHLRSLDDRRTRALVEAQRAQRLRLARDLHDFVAHDVSEMLALAQAGQVVAGDPGSGDPARSGEIFAAIEAAAQRALRSMDQTVHMLRDPQEGEGDGLDGSGVARRDLTELPALAARFAQANGIATSVRLEAIDDDLGEVPGEVSSALYRVVVEALTNVRRHAAGATTVTVAVRRVTLPDGARAVGVAVCDDGPGAGSPAGDGLGRHNGLGLPALREGVERLGGRLEAGARPEGGWEVRATVPWG